MTTKIQYRVERFDQLKLGDYIIQSFAGDSTTRVLQVTSLELAGDDVTVNGFLTSSVGNTITVVYV